MKTLLLIAAVGFIGYGLWSKMGHSESGALEPLHASSYVVVYGRDTCGITQRMLSDLDRSNTPYEYKSVDDGQVSNELHSRMETAGLSTRRYNLPVVDVNASLSIRPNASAVADQYQQFASASKTREVDERRADPGAIAATQHLADPLVECMIDGNRTFMLRSQCPH